MNRPRTTTLAVAGFAGALAVCLTWTGFKTLRADSYLLLYWGRYIADHGLPHREVFTLAAAGRPFADQQWLAGLLDYEAFKAAGYAGVALVSALCFGSGYALLALLMRRRGVSLALTVSCTTLAMLGAISLTFVRAQVFAVPLFVLLLWLCLEGPAVLILPLLALWANLHGSVLIGAAIAAVYLISRAASTRRIGYVALAAAAAAAPLATPYGTDILSYYGGLIGNHAVALADIEWDPPMFPALSFFQFVVPLIFAAAALVPAMMRGFRPSRALVIAIALTAGAGAVAMRDNIWLGIAAALLVADAAGAWLPTQDPRPAFIGSLSIGAAALAVFGAGRLVTRGGEGFQAAAPVGAIEATAAYAREHPCARVLADNTSASALLWLHPEIGGRVGFDAELDAYPAGALTRWIEFQAAQSPGWLAEAGGYQVLVGTSTDQPLLVSRLARRFDGHVLAHDARGIAVLAAAGDDTCKEAVVA